MSCHHDLQRAAGLFSFRFSIEKTLRWNSHQLICSGVRILKIVDFWRNGVLLSSVVVNTFYTVLSYNLLLFICNYWVFLLCILDSNGLKKNLLEGSERKMLISEHAHWEILSSLDLFYRKWLNKLISDDWKISSCIG